MNILKATVLAVLLAATAQAQIAIPVVTNLNQSVAWDPSPSPGVMGYNVLLTTNKLHLGTNGYNPPASALIQADFTPFLGIVISNLWPQITNGFYSAFVTASATGGEVSLTSSNLVFQVKLPLIPVRGLRIQ